MQSLIKNLDWRAYVAEFLGTYVVVFVACGVVLANKFWGEIGPVGVAIAYGFAVSGSMYSTVHISGGHLNPAITLSLWLAGKMQSVSAIFYILSQLAAGFAAAGTLLFIFSNRALEFFLGAPTLGSGIAFTNAVTVEVIASAFVVFAYFATIVDKQSLRSSSNEDSTAGLKHGPVSFGPLVVGLMVLVSTLFALPISGASLNAARAVGPLTITGSWDTLSLYIIGSATGSLFGIIYEFVFLKKGKK